MKFMKKMLVLALALCMVFGCAATASAATSPSKGGSATTKTNSISLKSSKKKTYKKAKLAKKSYSFKISAKAKSGTKLTFKKVAGCKYIKVSKSGKVTVKKNIFKHCKPNKKHAFKVKITAAAGKGYKKVSKTITFKVIIK